MVTRCACLRHVKRKTLNHTRCHTDSIQWRRSPTPCGDGAAAMSVGVRLSHSTAKAATCALRIEPEALREQRAQSLRDVTQWFS